MIGETLLNETWTRLLAADRPLLATHLKADGDAVGSTLGLALFLRSLGKTPTVLFPEGIPELYRLSAADFVTEVGRAWDDFDLVILLDCAIDKRAGLNAAGGVPAEVASKLQLIDHHPDNPAYGRWNCIAPAAATAELVLALCESSGAALPSEAADWLLMGLVTDTGGFRFDNTGAETFRSAARLLDRGASLNKVMNRVFFNKPYRQQLFEAELVSSCFHWASNGRMGWASVTPELLAKYDFSLSNAEGVIDQLRCIAGAEVVAIISRRDQGYRVSLRSKNPAVPVAELAHKYHGGGHAMAAGMTLDAPDFAAVEALLETESRALFADVPLPENR